MSRRFALSLRHIRQHTVSSVNFHSRDPSFATLYRYFPFAALLFYRHSHAEKFLSPTTYDGVPLIDRSEKPLDPEYPLRYDEYINSLAVLTISRLLYMTQPSATELAHRTLDIIPLVMRVMSAEMRTSKHAPASGHVSLLGMLQSRPYTLHELAERHSVRPPPCPAP